MGENQYALSINVLEYVFNKMAKPTKSKESKNKVVRPSPN